MRIEVGFKKFWTRILISEIFPIESFTADHKALVGPDIDLRGFYHACGFNSSGIMYAGGCGNQLAKWIIHGHPDLDMFAYDPRYI